MTATARMVETLRRMVAEPTQDTYSDLTLQEMIEDYPLLDDDGNDYSETDWEPNYDLHAAAADVWEQKAASFIEDFDFRADGAAYNLGDRQEQMMARVRYHRARVTPKSARLYKWPEERERLTWIGNLPESP